MSFASETTHVILLEQCLRVSVEHGRSIRYKGHDGIGVCVIIAGFVVRGQKGDFTKTLQVLSWAHE